MLFQVHMGLLKMLRIRAHVQSETTHTLPVPDKYYQSTESESLELAFLIILDYYYYFRLTVPSMLWHGWVSGRAFGL